MIKAKVATTNEGQNRYNLGFSTSPFIQLKLGVQLSYKRNMIRLINLVKFPTTAIFIIKTPSTTQRFLYIHGINLWNLLLCSRSYISTKCFTTNSLEGRTVLNKYDHEAIKTRTNYRKIMDDGKL